MQWISGCRAFSYNLNDLVVLTNLDMETNKHRYIVKLFNESNRVRTIKFCRVKILSAESILKSSRNRYLLLMGF